MYNLSLQIINPNFLTNVYKAVLQTSSINNSSQSLYTDIPDIMNKIHPFAVAAYITFLVSLSLIALG